MNEPERVKGIIANAIGFSVIEQVSPSSVYENEDGVPTVRIYDEDAEIIRSVADRVYTHLSESGYIDV